MANTLTTRRGVLRALAATAVAAAPVMANATGFLRGAGDIRRLKMYNGRAGESLDMIYWVDGDYIRPALEEIHYFFRDWRDNTVHAIDQRTIDILTAAHRLMDTDEPYTLLSGYRSPSTNAMLRSRSSGVARNSRHLRGEAADVQMQSRSVSQMYQAARACAAGGVGRYSRSGFVHVDCGPVRTWGG
ncbi:MAG: YcbK family protein [Roseicyclus sp.]